MKSTLRMSQQSLTPLLPSSLQSVTRLSQVSLFSSMSNPAWKLVRVQQMRQMTLSGLDLPCFCQVSLHCRWTAHTTCVSQTHYGIAHLQTLACALVLAMPFYFVPCLMPHYVSGCYSNPISQNDLPNGPGPGQCLCLSQSTNPIGSLFSIKPLHHPVHLIFSVWNDTVASVNSMSE